LQANFEHNLPLLANPESPDNPYRIALPASSQMFGVYTRRVVEFSPRLPREIIEFVIESRAPEFGVPPSELLAFVEGMQRYFVTVERDLTQCFSLSPPLIRAVADIPGHVNNVLPPTWCSGLQASSTSVQLAIVLMLMHMRRFWEAMRQCFMEYCAHVDTFYFRQFQFVFLQV
jgi:hypothetical protein